MMIIYLLKYLIKSCQLILFWRTNHAIAFHDIAPQAPIHILIIPKGKYVKYDDFLNKASKDEIYHFFKLINQLVKDYDLENTGYRLITNAGRNANQEVPHLHFHLLAGKNLGKM